VIGLGYSSFLGAQSPFVDWRGRPGDSCPAPGANRCLSRGCGLWRLVCRAVARRIGFAALPERGSVSRPRAHWNDRPTVPWGEPQVSPPRSLLFRVPSCRLLLRLFGGGDRLPGFGPHRGVVGCVHLARGFPEPRYVPPSGFLDLSAVSSALRLCGFVSPRSHVQDSSVQGVLSPRSHLPSSGRATSLPLGLRSLTARERLPRPAPSTSRSSSARRRVPFCGPCSASRAGLAFACPRSLRAYACSARELAGRSPLRISPPPGPHSLRLAPRSPASRPLVAFTGSLLAYATASPACLQRFSNGGSGSPVSRLTDLLEVLGLAESAARLRLQ
jgi:hypothetical protein